jgi:ketosteroid isomerase-like protein
MKRLMILTVGVCLLFAAMPVIAQSAADEAAIKKANEDRLTAYNAKDVKAYLPFMDVDCRNGFNGNPCSAAARESGEFPEGQKTAQIRILKEGDIQFITPDVAVYRYTMELTGTGSPDVDGNHEAARVYVKRDGKWLVAVGGVRRAVVEE